ncbi:Uncharacterized protein conserved in bacteria, putative virulence factor [gamma proteobacterium HdN1]|nr:Uncharacterized protein conserved in bacteria, putative virulence factor [gamma proteobacterium HdN1]
MLPELVQYESRMTLIMATGVQFLDFALKLDLRREPAGEFAPQQSNLSLARLHYDERTDQYFHPAEPSRAVASKISVPVDQSINLLDGMWLPIPFFRMAPSRKFAEGPGNWARARIVSLADGEDPDGYTHRVTLAFDTRVFHSRSDMAYLAPTSDDVKAGSSFGFAYRSDEMGWFPELAWVDSWLQEVFAENAQQRLRMQREDIEDERKLLYHQAHYLNLLYVLGSRLQLPEINVISNTASDLYKPIQVDMVLDVGNSRTCGILIEDHPQEGDGLRKRYELELRDLTMPEHIYPEPFESRVEFAQATFGKDHFSAQSGRSDAFLWPTIARVGRESARLASRRRGTEGSTGLSSPKRYLWDEDSYEPGWRFNCAFVKSESEPFATAAPVANLINETGDALYAIPWDQRMPVFHPHYSRSSLMTFMLSEVLVQALMQMNSPSQRLKQSHSRVPRHLRSIVLTVPPSMPKPERELFVKRVKQALGLVWKSMGWHPEDDDIENEGAAKAWPPMPTTHVQWDEATCGQIVYLFTETQNNFGGRPEEFFAALARPDKEDRKSLTVASVDIGGGTTDLVITRYKLDEGKGSNVFIVPEQRFRDGFKIAGDDILLEIIQNVVVPALSDALKKAGVSRPEALLSRMIGNETVRVQDAVLRQQLVLQVLSPIGLRLLKEYEKYDPLDPGTLGTFSFKELLSAEEPPTREVLEYVETAVRRYTDSSVAEFNLLDAFLTINLRKIHELFISNRMNICKSLKALSEIIYLYQCDLLLLTGRPSRLPGVQAVFRSLMPVPPGRILPLHQYRTGGWYPFHKQGRIDDPKTTAAVGAMLCLLGQNLRLPNFFFRSAALKPYSTVKYLGMIDNNNVVKDSNVYFHDINLDDPDYQFPDTAFELRGSLRLGFRQLDAERWPAAPLYIITLISEKLTKTVGQDGSVLNVSLKVDRKSRSAEGTESLTIASAESEAGTARKEALRMQLNTLADAGLGGTHYWLDSGSVYQ